MRKLVATGALAGLFAWPSAAFAFGPAMGLDADIGQLDAGFYDSDPASNAPNAGGVFADMTGSNFAFAPRPDFASFGRQGSLSRPDCSARYLGDLGVARRPQIAFD